MGYERCHYCGGTGSVLDTPNNIVSGQRPTGTGVTCPRCGGSGQGQLQHSNNTNSSSGDGEDSMYLLCVLATGVGAAIFYYLFGEMKIAGYIGAAVGFGISMLNESIRRSVINVIAMLTIMLAGLVIIGLLLEAFFG